MLCSSYLVTLVTSNNELNFLCEIPHFEPHLETQNRNRSIPYGTAIHLGSNKWFNASYFPYHMLIYNTFAILFL